MSDVSSTLIEKKQIDAPMLSTIDGITRSVRMLPCAPQRESHTIPPISMTMLAMATRRGPWRAVTDDASVGVAIASNANGISKRPASNGP